MSIQVLSTPVEQTYLNAMSPYRHLSSLTSVPRLLLDSQEMLPSPADDILLASSPPKSTFTSHMISRANNKTLDPVKHRIMARSDEQLLASRRSAAVCGTDRCDGDFARSSSMADLKAGSRTLKADYSSDLRRVLPSVSNLRNLAHNQDINARNTGLTQTNPMSAMPQQSHLVASNLQDEHTYNEKKLRRKFRYRSYQDLHILSLYQENISTGSLRSFARTGPISDGSDEPSSASSSDSGSSRTSSPAPKTPIDQRPQNEAENAKVRRAHARQVHVIEQRQGPEFAEDEDHGEEEIIQVIVLDLPKS